MIAEILIYLKTRRPNKEFLFQMELTAAEKMQVRGWDGVLSSFGLKDDLHYSLSPNLKDLS